MNKNLERDNLDEAASGSERKSEDLAGSGDSAVSRRRALLAGLAAMPVVVTLLNRSAFATTCTSASHSLQSATSLRHFDTAQGHNCGTTAP